MHELPIVEKIIEIVLRHAQAASATKIVSISIVLGGFSDLEDEWINRYFQYASKDTIASDAKLNIERIKPTLFCKSCSSSFEIDIHKVQELKCPFCNQEKELSVSKSTDYLIKNIEVI